MIKTDSIISIVIPTYNRAQLITETLNSILSQTYTNWECLIVDDGSTDNSESIINEYNLKDSRIKFFNRPYNRLKGANACRNYGFECSNGDFVIWFDSDDIMHPNYLELQLKNLSKTNLNYSICKSKWLTIEGKVLDGFRSANLQSLDPINDYIQFNIFWPINAVCYKSNFLKKNKLQFDETLQQSQEYDFHVKVLQIDKDYGVIDQKLITIVASEDSISYSDSNSLSKTKSSLKVKRCFLRNSDNLNLTTRTKYFLFHDMHRVFQQQTMKRHIKVSFYAAYVYLYAHLLDKAIFRHYFFKHFIPVITLCFSYNLFGIGYKLFKKSNTFNYTKKSTY